MPPRKGKRRPRFACAGCWRKVAASGEAAAVNSWGQRHLRNHRQLSDGKPTGPWCSYPWSQLPEVTRAS